MFLPSYYDDPVSEYWHLLEYVTLWDVSVERQVEITGPDASRFTNLLTPRDLSWCRVGQGRYALITAEDRGIVNDPVLLRLGENYFWLAAADSDVLLWAKGVAMNSGMRVEELRRTEPEKKRDWWPPRFRNQSRGSDVNESRSTHKEGIPCPHK
jgi:glycine cleavage system aminomethyltransferase T